MRYALPDRLGHVDGEDLHPDDHAVYLMVLPDGPPVVLRDSAALIWRVAVSGEDVLAGVCRATGLTPGDVAADVTEFLEQAVAHGLLDARPQEAR